MSPREKTKAREPFADPAKEVDRQKEIERLEKDVEELRHLAGDADADAELGRIREQVAELRREFYTHLGPWHARADRAPPAAAIHAGFYWSAIPGVYGAPR